MFHEDDRDDHDETYKLTPVGIIALCVMCISLAGLFAIIYFASRDKPAEFPVPTTVIMPIESQPAPAPVLIPTPAPSPAPVVVVEPTKPEATETPEVTPTTTMKE